MTTRIAITGVDGSGKTTVVRALAAKFADRPNEVIALRAPQYHENPDAPFASLSAEIDALSVQADESRNTRLKASALFLSMTLHGAVADHFARAFEPRWLFVERDPVLDSVAYSSFYLRALRAAKALPKGAIPLTSAGLARWLTVVSARASGPLDLASLPEFLIRLFERSPRELLIELPRVYGCTLPERLILLRVDPGRLVERLTSKRAGGTPRELHEKTEILVALQDALDRAASALAEAAPSCRVIRLDVSDLTLEETVAQVIEIASA